MANSKDTIKSILKDLTSVHENLLALSEDIWNSINMRKGNYAKHTH